MDKSVFDSIVAKLKEKGITEYNVRIEGGNKNLFHNGKTDLVFSTDDAIIGIKATQNYAAKGNYDITWCHWDDVNCVKLTAATIQNMLDIAPAFGLDEDLIKSMIQDNTIVRRDIVPGTARLDAMRNDKGEPVVANSAVYVTDGLVPDVKTVNNSTDEPDPKGVATL